MDHREIAEGRGGATFFKNCQIRLHAHEDDVDNKNAQLTGMTG